jgi:hypothetical protein
VNYARYTAAAQAHVDGTCFGARVFGPDEIAAVHDAEAERLMIEYNRQIGPHCRDTALGLAEALLDRRLDLVAAESQNMALADRARSWVWLLVIAAPLARIAIGVLRRSKD